MIGIIMDILFRGIHKMKEKIVRLPYEKRNEFIDVILELNQCIDASGMLQICIDNHAANKELYLIFENSRWFKIHRIIKKNHLELIKGSGVQELLETLINDENNIVPLALNEDSDKLYQYLL